jgi:hypothetical protein
MSIRPRASRFSPPETSSAEIVAIPTLYQAADIYDRGYPTGLIQIVGGTSTTIKLGDDIRSKLLGEAKVRGINSWNAICFRTILENPAYLHFIATEPI